MQKLILIALFVVAGAVTSQAQSLKDMLYGGKLRMDSNAVLRKTDDLKARLDTGQKKPVDTAKVAAAAAAVEAAAKPMATNAVVTADGIVQKPSTAVVADTATGSVSLSNAPEKAPISSKTNTRLWKEYTDSLVKTIKADILSNKKIKKEIYNLNVSYEIDTNGMVNILNVTATPENTLLQAQVKQLMESTPLQLNPMLDSAGKPKKANRSHNFVVSKD